MTTADHSFEWLKILVSTVAGLFVGLIAEPIKSTLQRKIEVIRLERAIGMDCLRILAAISTVRAGLLENPATIWQMDLIPAYQHYWTSKRELFYTDFDLQLIQMHCMNIDLTRHSVLGDRMNADDAINKTETLAQAILHIRDDKKGFRTSTRRFLLRFVT